MPLGNIARNGPRIFVSAAIAALVASCVSRPELPDLSWNAPPSAALPQLGVKLIAAMPRTGNSVASPLSLGAALDLVAIGGNDAMRATVRQATGIGTAAGDPAAPTLRAWDEHLVSLARNCGIGLTIANAVWADRRAALVPDYRRATRRDADAPTTRLDLSSDSAVTRINDWVAHATQGKIPALLSAPTGHGPDSVTVTNAIYFRGGWMEPFDPSQTTVQPFHRPGAADVQTELMSQTSGFSYRQEPAFQAVQLYFGQEGNYVTYTLTILLPKRVDADPAALLDSAGPKLLDALEGNGFNDNPGTVLLPRLHLNETIQPLALLQNSEIVSAIKRPGALTRMFVDPPEQVGLDSVQKAVMDLDEKGAVVAVATSMSVVSAGIEVPVTPPPPFVLRADHPFWFSLRESTTGAVLLMGIVRQP